MGFVKKLRKASKNRKIATKAAQAKAKAEVKSAAKLKKNQEKLLANQHKRVLKLEQAGAKRRQKHERKLAKQELAIAKAGRFNKDTVKRYLGAGRLLVPLAVPLFYRLLTAGKQQLENRRARALGVSPDQLAKFAGHGAPLHAKLETLEKPLETANVPSGFKKDVRNRIQELHTAIDNAENLAPEQRKRAHDSITKDIERLSSEIQARLKAA